METKTIFQKLLAIQIALKAPKNQRNNFWNYNYRSCEDILEAIKPLLLENECTLVINDEIVNIWNRFYIKAKVTLYDTAKEFIFVEAFAREEETKKWMDWSQITWASSSYARKYALNWLFLIDDTKDSDSTNTHEKDKQEPKLAPLPDEQWNTNTESLQSLEKPSYWKCTKCWAENVKSPKTWKIFCSKKCFIK